MTMNDTFFKNYPGHDRLELPEPLVRVTAGKGGEALLILGSEKTGIFSHFGDGSFPLH